MREKRATKRGENIQKGGEREPDKNSKTKKEQKFIIIIIIIIILFQFLQFSGVMVMRISCQSALVIPAVYFVVML